MSTSRSEIEIQAVNLAQQWYSLSDKDRPSVTTLLPAYLKCFSSTEDKAAFLEETLRIASELVSGPKRQANDSESFEQLTTALRNYSITSDLG
jgi:hypothetical protein